MYAIGFLFVYYDAQELCRVRSNCLATDCCHHLLLLLLYRDGLPSLLITFGISMEVVTLRTNLLGMTLRYSEVALVVKCFVSFMLNQP